MQYVILYLLSARHAAYLQPGYFNLSFGISDPGTRALNCSVVSPSVITLLSFPWALCGEIKASGMLRYVGDGGYPRKLTGITDGCLEEMALTARNPVTSVVTLG